MAVVHATAAHKLGDGRLGQTSLTFDEFLLAYGKQYSDGDYHMRKDLFEKRRAEVVQPNTLYASGSSGWWATINVAPPRSSPCPSVKSSNSKLM